MAQVRPRPESVKASFLYVRSGETARPANLPGRAELERILLEEPGTDRGTDRGMDRGEQSGDEPPDDPVPAGG